MAGLLELAQGSAHDLRFLPDGSVHAVITSPPYMGLRSYAGDQDIDWPAVEYAPMAGLPVVVVPAQRCALGGEADPFAYVGHLILCLREWWRVLRDDGVALINLGDSYASSTKGSGGCPPGSIMDSRPNSLQIAQKFKPIKIDIRSAGLKPKDLMMIPARFALAAQADGWYLRAGIVWAKGVSFLADYAGSSMPESVKDRPARSHEDIFLLAKRERYFWDSRAVAELARAARLTTLCGSALTPKPSATLDADNSTAHLRGQLDFSQLEVPVVFSVAKKTKHLKVVKAICFEVVSEIPEWNFMINLEISGSAALLALVTSTLQSYAANDTPVRAAIVDAPSAECGVSLSNIMDAGPFTETLFTAKTMIEARSLLAGVPIEGVPAIIALGSDNFGFPFPVGGILRSSHMPHNTINTTILQNQGDATRNLRSVWVINPRPFSAAHFACWPETLVDPMIRAATSERGVCPACGAPWVRVVERGEEVAQRWAPGASVIDQVYDDQVGASSVLRTGTMAEIVTAGWLPSCGCSCVPGGTVRYDPVPATVLDPFSGSATTGKVCAKLGRRYIGVDLAAEYLGAVTDARMGDGVQMELV